MYTTINGYASPMAYVAKDKQRLKQYNDTVYLNNGDEFQLELFNPTSNKVLAKIELNGNSIGTGIVLRPGERVFLERYLDVSRKFLFETYNVEGENNEIKKSIETNGSVHVKFFTEFTPINYINNSFLGTIGTGGYNSSINTFTDLTYKNTRGFLYGTSTLTSSLSDNTLRSALPNTKSIETGRIEKGSESNQNFKFDSSSFNLWHSWVTNWKILPISQKLSTIDDIKIYCSSCRRLQKNDKEIFCPSCGTKYYSLPETKIIYIDSNIYNDENGISKYLYQYNITMDKFLEINKNKLIVINKTTISEKGFMGIVIN